MYIISIKKMTEQYWQRYIEITAWEPLNRKDPFWSGIKTAMDKRKQPKHHL